MALSRNLNVPNALSLLRLIGVPYFFWLIVAQEDYVRAIVVLLVSGFTDWLDGYVARKLNQQTRLGELLDPVVDRLYIACAVIALVMVGELPIGIVLILLSRDVFLAVLVALLKRKGFSGFPVHFIGKAATMNLLWAFPLVLLGTFDSTLGRVAHQVAMAFLIWGLALYWYAGMLYLQQFRKIGAVNTL